MRLAILDLGTNTFHLLIVDVNSEGATKTIYKSKRTVKLGEGAIHKSWIDVLPYDRGLHAIQEYAKIIRRHQADKVYGFATSAIRSATNGRRFVEEIFRVTGIRIEVISGLREAELIYYGVNQCVSIGERPALIMDIGGGSTEFIIADSSKIFWMHSFDIGAARLREMFRLSDPAAASEVRKIRLFLAKELQPLQDAVKKYPVRKLIGASGSFDTLAEMIGWHFHRHNSIKGVKTYRFNLEEYNQMHERLLSSTTKQRLKMKGLIKMRVDMIVPASICTHYVLKKFRLKEMILSKYALKEGALWELAGG